MGKLGRFACIFVPMGLSIASLVCLVLVWVGNTSTDGIPSTVWWFKADLSDFTTDPDILKGTDYDDKLLNLLDASTQSGDLKDIYTVGLWNYCSGSKVDNGDMNLDYCSPRTKNYWFNPTEVWGLQNDAADDIIGDKLNKALDAYKKVIGWMFTAYAVAFFVTAAEIVIGFFAIFSRWGSFATTIVSGISSFFVLAATITGTAVYAAVVGGINTVFEPFHIEATLGGSMLTISWLASAFSIAAGFFWLISVCCCSGRSSSPAHVESGRKKGAFAEKTPYSYERVATPVGGSTHRSSGAPILGGNPYTGPYEPYRHS